MQEVTEDYKTIIRNQQQEIENLKEKVKRLSNEIFDVQENIKKYASIALIAALVLQTVHYLLWFVIKPGFPDNKAVYLGIEIFTTLRSLLFIFAILGLGSRYLNFNNRFLRYANEAVLPFYILHQTIILIIGFLVIQWSMGIAPKYLIISATSFVAILAIYELLIRRINILQFLFGMRWRKKTGK